MGKRRAVLVVEYDSPGEGWDHDAAWWEQHIKVWRCRVEVQEDRATP